MSYQEPTPSMHGTSRGKGSSPIRERSKTRSSTSTMSGLIRVYVVKEKLEGRTICSGKPPPRYRIGVSGKSSERKRK